jgi:CRP/FNR family transcriptional regulator, cyclic AMP receptor protein
VNDQNQPPAPLAVYTFADDDIFSDVTPEQRALLDRAISFADYPSGRIFYAPEEHGDRLYILRRGRVRIYKLSPEGRALTLLILEPSSIFGEMALEPEWLHDSFAETMTESTIGAIRRDDMRRVLNANPAVALRFMNIMSQRLRALERKLADIAFKSVPQRLATVLLNLADRQEASPDRTAPPAVVRYTHQQLAEMIGSYRETVTKAIGDLREGGLIRVDEEVIYLTDLARLRELMAGKP